MRIPSAITWTLGSAVLASLLAVSVAGLSRQATAPQQQTTVPKDDAKEFQARIDKYLAIQKKAVGSVPAQSNKKVADPALIVQHEKQLADAIRALRPNAMPGEIFTPWLRGVIAKAVKEQVQGARGKEAKASILDEGNPKGAESTVPVTIKVNGGYPQDAPLSTVPPSVLLALPTLPKEIEYRFVGRNLILRDTKANIVVDILTNAF
jgi:hypothetical protein